MRRLSLVAVALLAFAAPVTADPGPTTPAPKLVVRPLPVQEELPPAGADEMHVIIETGPDGQAIYHVSPASMAAAVAAAIPGSAGHILVDAPRPAVQQPGAAAPAAKDPDPMTQGWLDHCQLLEERGIGRGAQIGGNGAFGMRLGGKGQSDQLEDVSDAVRASVDGWNEQGALVVSVVPGAPAEISGLQPGDVVVQIAGLWVDTPDMLIRLASRAEVGRELELLYLREGELQRTWVSAIDRKEMEQLQQ